MKIRMRIPSAHRKPLFLALLVTVVCFATSVELYARLLEKDEAPVPLLPVLIEGVHEYEVFSGSRCVGSFVSSFIYDGKYQLESELVLRMRARERSKVVSANLQATFNSLGQLGGSILTIVLDNATVTIGTTDVNPFNVVLGLKSPRRNFRFSYLFPGPIELVREGAGQFRLRYRYLSEQGLAAPTQSSVPPIFKALQLNVLPRQGEGFCVDAEASIQLDPLIDWVETLATRYDSLFSGGLVW